MSRKQTDSVALNALEGDGKTAQENVVEVGASTSNMGEPSDKSSSGAATPGERAEQDLKMFRTLHKWDPNLERQ